MRKFVVLFKFQALAATGLITLSAALSLPALAQQGGEGAGTAPVEVVTPVVEDEATEAAESLEALTADDSEIPTDQLEILLKPLPQEQVQAEADAWYGLLQEKAQEISDLEYDIKIREEEIGGAVDSKKEKNVVAVTELKTEQTTLVSRLNTVLDSLEAKGGDPTLYRQYADAVSGLEFNITDTEGIGLRFTTWLQSEEGGIKWGLNILKVGGILIAAAFIAPRAGKLTDKALVRVENISNLFRGFIVMVIKRAVLVTGGLLALASIGVNLGPILAVVGGASFVLAFALQSNLGNFASGLMLLVNKPFDVGDEIKVGGYYAVVQAISLANTKLRDFNGTVITLPNNMVWGGDIKNFTPKDTRRLAFKMNVKFTTDLEKLGAIWKEINAENPDTLENPGPTVFPYNDSFDYYLAVDLKAWCPTKRYWFAYYDLLRALQERLPAAGIELVSPVQYREIAHAGEIEGAQLPSLTASN